MCYFAYLLVRKDLLKHPWMGTSVTPDVYELINSPNAEIPEELLNSIRHHITSSDVIGGANDPLGTWKQAESFVHVDPFQPSIPVGQP